MKKVTVLAWLGNGAHATGAGASTPGNSWVNKFAAYAASNGGHAVVQRSSIETALAENPTVILFVMNLDAAYSSAGSEYAFISSYQTIQRKCDSAGVVFWVATRSPGAGLRSYNNRQDFVSLKTVEPNPGRTIDFFSGLARSNNSSWLDELRSGMNGDLPNDTGHDSLFQRVKRSGILTETQLKPLFPEVTRDHFAQTIRAYHPLGDSQIEVSENGGSWIPYPGTMNVTITGGRPDGYWRFRIKSTPGRDQSGIAYSPFFSRSYNPAQARKVVVLGSSTAAGTGAYPADSSFVNRYAFYLKQRNYYDTIYNLAAGGYDTRSIMPTGTGVGEDPERNITKALSFNPYAILVNLPSNDIANGVSNATTMANYRTIVRKADSAGVPIWITTTQPRNSVDYLLLFQQKDSIIAQFPTRYIDFYTGLSDGPASGNIAPAFSWGDGIHLNDRGHDTLYRRVARQLNLVTLISLPVKFLEFKILQDKIGERKLTWNTTGEPISQFAVQKSVDGVFFKTIGLTASSNNLHYLFTDHQAFEPEAYYRIQAMTLTGTYYSAVIKTHFRNSTVIKVSQANGRSQLRLNLSSFIVDRYKLELFSITGQPIFSTFLRYNGVQSIYLLQTPQHLAAGYYLLHLSNSRFNFTEKVFLY